MKEIFPMSTPKGIFLELIKPDGQPERQLCQYEALHMCLTDPINTYLRGNRKRGTTSRDRWGTTILFPEDAPGPMPDTREGLAVCPDITRWRETVHAPDLEAACTEGWEACRAEARAACGPDHLLAGFMGTGVLSSATFSWVLRIRSRTSMHIRTRCTRSSTTSPSTA